RARPNRPAQPFSRRFSSLLRTPVAVASHSGAPRCAPYNLRMARLPAPLQNRLEEAARGYFDAPGLSLDFRQPAGAAALFAPTSVAGRVMKPRVALTIGAIAAVILELPEPRVRTGVWEHTTFRPDPVARMRRTGRAAMVTV